MIVQLDGIRSWKLPTAFSRKRERSCNQPPPGRVRTPCLFSSPGKDLKSGIG
jgi:hypothetical protein